MGALVGRKALMQASVGKGHSVKHRALDLAASIMQPKYPIEAISTFLNGFHFYADDMGRQIEAHHFCIHLQHDFHECIIFDSNQPGARLIGIEYIVSEERFRPDPDFVEDNPLPSVRAPREREVCLTRLQALAA